MSRYVILTHDHPHLHWDLMLEVDDTLITWRLNAPPADRQSMSAEPLPNHRLHYLDYEGPVSGQRGTVTRWERGLFEFIERSDYLYVARVQGDKLNGELTIKKQSSHDDWQVTYLSSSAKSGSSA